MRIKLGVSYGHGGVLHDYGANGHVKELNVNKEVVDNLIKLIKEDNLIDVIRCNNATDFRFKEQYENLNYICNKANQNKVDIFMDIHHNAGGGQGVEVFAISDKARKLANEISVEIAEDMDLINRGVKNKAFYVLKNTNMPAILVEGWFVDTKKDYEKFLKYGAITEAKAILKGIYDYYGFKKPPVIKDKQYIVKQGDTLYRIARDLGVTVDYLVEKNNIKNKNIIFSGTILKY